MKFKVKVDEERVTIYKSDDSILSIWNKKKIDDAGGVDKIVERFKKKNPKLQVEMIRDPGAPAPTPAPAAPAQAPEAKPVETEIKSV